jgi:hypothetical protein
MHIEINGIINHMQSFAEYLEDDDDLECAGIVWEYRDYNDSKNTVYSNGYVDMNQAEI